MKENGKVLTFGYATTGMSNSRGFNKEKVYIINHSGDHNDTLCVIERKGKPQIKVKEVRRISKKLNNIIKNLKIY
ncbi:MAG: hypothetical protein ACOCP8_10135 [archaeon]